LAKVPIFSGLTENALAFLAQRAVARHYYDGEVVFSESEPHSFMYVVQCRHIAIFKGICGGRHHQLSSEGPVCAG